MANANLACPKKFTPLLATFPLYGTGGLAQRRAGRKMKKRNSEATGFFIMTFISDKCEGLSRFGASFTKAPVQ